MMMARADHPAAPAELDDRPVLSSRQRRLVCLLGPIVASTLAFALAGQWRLPRLEGMSIDARFRLRGPRTPPDKIVIVEMDDRSRRALAKNDRRLDLRRVLADAVDRLAEAGALAIGLDVYLDGRADPEVDTSLADVFSRTNVVVAVAQADGRLIRAPAELRPASVTEGVVTVYPDDDNVLRRFPPLLYVNILDDADPTRAAEYIPQFPLALAAYVVAETDPDATVVFRTGGASIGDRSIRDGELIDYCSPRRDDAGRLLWNTLRLEDVVAGNFSPDAVDGRVVIIGESRTVKDVFRLPMDDRLTPGIYYHANAVAHIIDRRGFDESPTSAWRLGLLCAGLTLATGLWSWRLPRLGACAGPTLRLVSDIAVSFVIFVGGWFVAAHGLFLRQMMLPVALPTTCIVTTLSLGFLIRWIVAHETARRQERRAQRIEALFGQCVSPQVLDAIKQDPCGIGRTCVRDVSVLFCDLRGFTALSCTLSPLEVAAMLNDYFNHITAAIFEHDGFVDKFVGDLVMAVFSAPMRQDDHALRAVMSAVGIKHRLVECNRERVARGLPPLDCGIGIHTGPAALGYIGSESRSNYTVVGAVVNLAARIQHVAESGEVLVTDDTRRALPDERLLRPWKSVEIRGVPGRQTLHEVLLNAPDGDRSRT